MTLYDQLAEKYLNILNKPEYHPLITQIAEDHQKGKGNGLSDIFLGFVPSHYDINQNNILIVGRETRGWYISDINPMYHSLDDIKLSMQRSESCFYHLIKQHKTFSFFDFVGRVAHHAGENNLLWGNLFCVDYRNKNPKNHSLFQMIKALSQELLLAQIHTLKPKIIVLANGLDKSAVHARYEYFPKLSWTNDGFDDIPKKYLQQCFLFEEKAEYQPICYRTCHPASLNRPKNKKIKQQAIKKLIDILPNKS